MNCALIKLDVPTVKAVYKKLKKVKMWDVGAEEGGVKRKSEGEAEEEGGGKRLKTE